MIPIDEAILETFFLLQQQALSSSHCFVLSSHGTSIYSCVWDPTDSPLLEEVLLPGMPAYLVEQLEQMLGSKMGELLGSNHLEEVLVQGAFQS